MRSSLYEASLTVLYKQIQASVSGHCPTLEIFDKGEQGFILKHE